MAYDHYSQAAQEDRCDTRHRVELRASLRPSAARGFTTIVRDISTSGFSAEALTRLPVGTICWVTLPGLETMQCEVIWWAGSIVGCAFANLMNPIVLEAHIERWRAQQMV